MATAQNATVKTGGAGQFESFVEKQLTTAKRRLRGLDLARWGFALAIVLLGYGLVASLADLLWQLPTVTRFIAWCVLVAVTLALLGAAISRHFFQKINARFLARQLELTVPQAKNSVINWLDLREQPLSPVIRGSLGRRAAKDLGHANTEGAISARGVWWFGGIACLLLLIQLGWLIAAPGQASSLLQRAFFPFDMSRIALRTSLTLLEPAAGDVSIPANQALRIRVQAEGYVPDVNHSDSLKLHFRYQKDELFEERALQRDADGVWTTTVLADQVRTGFWYKISGGDASLPEDREYRVDVSTAPQVLRFEAVFKYRPYLVAKDRTVLFDRNSRPSIKVMRGTEVSLVVRTNRLLRQCGLELTSGGDRKTLPGEAVLGDAEAWRFKWVLDQSGSFRVLFVSKEGEENVDRQPYKVEVIPDLAPEIVITNPAKDVALPANGTLYVEGKAEDDFGIKSMQMRLNVLQPPGNVQLRSKIYRPELSFQLPNGKFPQLLDYSDFVALDDIRTINGDHFPISAGMELEYWLEARDNCDYPDAIGNLGKSTKYKLTVTPPEMNKDKAAQDRNAAQQKAGQNQKNQDSKLDGQKMQAAAEKNAGGQNDGEKKGGAGQGSQELDNDAKKVDEAMKNDSKLGAAKGQDDSKQDEPGKGPSDSTAKKDGPNNKQDQNNPGKDNNPGAEKNQPKDQKNDAKDQTKDSAGAGKGNPDASKEPPGKSKSGDPKDGGNKGAAKEPPGTTKGSDPKPGSKDDPSTAKGGGDKDNKGEIGKDKGPGAKGGDAKDKDGGPGQPKDATVTDKAAAKDAPLMKELVAGAKGGEPDPTGQLPADGKAGPPDASQQPGNAKASDRKDATIDDVNKLREQLGDAGLKELAKKGLENIGDQASDPKVRQEAEKALDQAKAQPGAEKTGGQSGDPSLDKTGDGKTDGKSDLKQGAAPGDQPKAGTGKGVSDSNKAGSSGKGDPGQPKIANPGGKGTGNVGPDDPGLVNPVDEAAARRAGELQLETVKQQIDKLRDKFTPEVMKNLKWSDKDREDFLRKMMADALNRQQLQKLPGEKLPPPGSIQSLLPGTGPRNLQQDPATKGGVIIENPEAPPEVRDALRLFNGKK